MSSSVNYMIPYSETSLEVYLQAASQIPVLEAEQELDLARKLKYEHDLEAARKLVMAHLRFVIHIAKGYIGYGLALPDLIQEGNVGLMKAVKRFDPEQGVRLISFAVHWIRAEIHEFIIRNWKIVKIATTKAQRKLFFNLRSAKKSLEWLKPEDVDAVARELNVKPETVTEMEMRMSASDVAFDKQDDDADDDTFMSPAEYISDYRLEPSTVLEQHNHVDDRQARLHHALNQLDERGRAIIESRWLTENKATLTDLAEKFQVSAERIRQLENKAMKSLQQFMTA